MAETSPARLAETRTRLLTFVRNASVDLAVNADDYGDYVAVDTSRFYDLIRWINRLMNFEDAHDDSNDSPS
ncbi:MAG TPA: hypothetical protein VF266_23505 [Thermoanaerobaculia bacterium]